MTKKPAGNTSRFLSTQLIKQVIKVVLEVMFVSHQRKLFLILDLLSAETHKTLSLT